MTTKTSPTNQEVADRIGCTHSMVSRLRSGVRLPSLDLMQQIAREYKIRLPELIAARNDGPEAFGALFRRRVFGVQEQEPAATQAHDELRLPG